MKTPTEHDHCKWLAQWLDAKGVVFCHVPNERESAATRRKLAEIGTSPGVPDFLIFSWPGGPTARPSYPGVAIEMKRPKGGRVSAAQDKWLTHLELLGWSVHVAYGFDDAVAFLEGLGF